MNRDREKIKIAHFLNSNVIGGVEHHVILLVNNLSRESFEPIVVCPPTLAGLFKPYLNDDVRIEPIEVRNIFNFKEMLRLVGFFRREKVDIVHAHLSYASRMSHMLAKLAGVPYTIETSHVREAWRKGFLKTWYGIDRFIAAFTDRFIAVSKANGDYLSGVKGINPKKITVVPNGIDTKSFDVSGDKKPGVREELKISEERPLITTVARLEPQKGINYLLRAVPSIVERHHDALFFLVGDGALRGELEVLSESLGITDNVIFAGFRKDIAEILRESTIFVLPSLWEGLPLVAIEASAAATPVVATAVDGTPEVIMDMETGLLVEPKKVEPLAFAITSLLNDPAWARELGLRGAEFARAKFDISRQVSETEAVYFEAAAIGELTEVVTP
jgi:glycosyltransferase involved in cell wall biosynthesis